MLLESLIKARFHLLWLVLVLCVWGATYLLYAIEREALHVEHQTQQQLALSEATQDLRLRLAEAKRDAAYLSRLPSVTDFIGGGGSHRGAVLLDLETFIAARAGQYLQIRVLDLTGLEVVNVRQDGGQTRIVPLDELQDMGGQPYVNMGQALSPGEVLVSPLELDVAHGQVSSLHSTVRFVAKTDGGAAHGLVVLNYDANILLADVARIADERGLGLWLIDSHGRWLRGPYADELRNGGSLLKDRGSLSERYPETWAALQATPQAAGQHLDGGLSSFALVEPKGGTGQSVDDPTWHLIAHTPPEKLAVVRGQLSDRYFWWALLSAVLLGILVLGLALFDDQRRAAATTAEASERRFAALVESAPDAIVISDSRGRISFANRQAETLFGYEAEQLVGQTVEVLIPARFRDPHAGYRKGYLEGPSIRQMGSGRGLWGLRKDGREFSISISLGSFDQGGQRWVVNTMRDITEEVHARDAVTRLNDELEVNLATTKGLQERLELAVSAGRIGIWDWDIVNDELLWDDMMLQIYGIERAQFRGAYETWMSAVHPEDAAFCDHTINRTLHGGEPYDISFRIVRPDGEERLIKADARVVRDGEGRALRIVGTNYDITGRESASDNNRISAAR